MDEKFGVTAILKIDLSTDDIDDIVCTALEGGINYWCCKAEVVGKYLGEYASDQISRGGSLILYDSESNDKWELTFDKLLKGVAFWLASNHNLAIKNNRIDTCDIDGNAADFIVQYALFGELVFG
ncbi:MAG TPA: hypothetical protein DEP23_11180 [Ruminococcaceae bacterium]|jgi:hypothetical protein|nr:hypothetical protein [Bacillota bacterium]HCA30079.1 hypothetical protein [Oscillospiraceae bacterium]